MWLISHNSNKLFTFLTFKTFLIDIQSRPDPEGVNVRIEGEGAGEILSPRDQYEFNFKRFADIPTYRHESLTF